MKAKEFMTQNPATINMNKTVEEAAQIMLEKDIGSLLVVDDSNKLIGILTESDFVGKKVDIPHALVSLKQLLGRTFSNQSVDEIFSNAKKHPVSSVMTNHPITISPEANLNEIVELMTSKNLKRFPVLDGDKIVGVVSRRDLIRAFSKVK
ncbi:MAG: CBS domain-containing protein [Halobacteriovoraceae bacterium]|nr:CBS domain-containing protein [Halobacteriovoraceae bacterium]